MYADITDQSYPFDINADTIPAKIFCVLVVYLRLELRKIPLFKIPPQNKHHISETHLTLLVNYTSASEPLICQSISCHLQES